MIEAGLDDDRWHEARKRASVIACLSFAASEPARLSVAEAARELGVDRAIWQELLERDCIDAEDPSALRVLLARASGETSPFEVGTTHAI